MVVPVVDYLETKFTWLRRILWFSRSLAYLRISFYNRDQAYIGHLAWYSRFHFLLSNTYLHIKLVR